MMAISGQKHRYSSPDTEVSGAVGLSSGLLGQGTNNSALVLGVPEVSFSCSSGLGLAVLGAIGAACCIASPKVREHGA